MLKVIQVIYTIPNYYIVTRKENMKNLNTQNYH